MKNLNNMSGVNLIISLVLFCSISFTSNCLFADDKPEKLNEILSDAQSNRIHDSLMQIAIESINATEGNVDIIQNDILKMINKVEVMETGFWTNDLNKIVQEIDSNIKDSQKVVEVLEKDIERVRKNGNIQREMELENKITVQKTAVSQLNAIKSELSNKLLKYNKFLEEKIKERVSTALN